MRKLFFILCFLFAQVVLGQNVFTLNQAIEQALQNNYDVQIVKNKSTITAINSSASVANFLPQVGLNVNAGGSINHLHQQLSNNTEVNRDGVKGSNINPSVIVSWTLFDGMKMFATKNRLKRLQEIGELNYRDTLQTLIAQVITAYYDVVSSNMQLKALNDAMKISEERVKLTEKQFLIGSASKVDWLQARVDLNEEKSAAIAQQTLIEQKKADFNRLLALAPDNNFSTIDSIPFNDNLSLLSSNELDKRNYQLLIAAKNKEAIQFSKNEILSNYLPQLTVNGAYGFNQSKNSAGFTLLNQTQGFSGGLSLYVPLFNGTLTQKQVKVADINVLNAETTFKKIHLLTATKYFKAQKDFEKAKQTLKLEQENILLADENLKIATERFRLGQSTAIEMRQAETSYTSAMSRLVNAKFNSKSSETELLRLMGQLVKE